MAWGARWYLVGSIVLGVLGVLAGCSGGNMFAEREPWRREAEVQCLNAGAVREGPGVVRIRSIQGPGVCGADFPFKVSMLGESSPLGYSDDLRPPGDIPGRPGSAPRAGRSGRRSRRRSNSNRPISPACFRNTSRARCNRHHAAPHPTSRCRLNRRA